MTETAPAAELPALEQFQRITELSGRAQQLMLSWWVKQDRGANPDPMGLAALWGEVASAAAQDPAAMVRAGTEFWTEQLKLWTAMWTGSSTAVPPPPKDKRFAGEAWRDWPVFDLVRRSYLLASEHVLRGVAEVDGLDPETQARALFTAKQFVDAMSPSNFPLTNPEVLRAAAETNGESLIKGLEHMLADLERGKMTMADERAFEVGVNVATAPGKVIFENRLFQLIQYAPATETVFEVPLLIIPPWINKFYILDLTPEKSFVRWAVAQGLTVFLVSWRNPDSSLRDTTLDDYVLDGELKALDVALAAAGASQAHTIGYCVAGTVLAAALSYLQATSGAAKVASATFFTAQVDFTDGGDLRNFITDAQLGMIEQMSAATGYLDGRAMASAFNMLRSNDLIWNYVVNNYLLGKEYVPFDLLYWNSDATNVPARWHAEYLRDMYRDNKLAQPGGIVVAGVPIDVGKVTTPAFVQAGREDHIAPAKSSWKLAAMLGGPVRFVLAGSGHIAGVVNPPVANKYQHWVVDGDHLPADFAAFQTAAREVKGSWWPDWIDWLRPLSGAQVPARVPADSIEDAPGRYVKERI